MQGLAARARDKRVRVARNPFVILIDSVKKNCAINCFLVAIR